MNAPTPSSAEVTVGAQLDDALSGAESSPSTVERSRHASGATPVEVTWFRRIVGDLRPHRRLVLLAMGGALLGALTAILVPVIVRDVVDRALDRGTGHVTAGVAALVGLAVFRGVATWMRRWFGGRVAIEAETDLRCRLHAHLQQLDPVTHGALSQGQVVSRANADVTMINQLISTIPLVSSSVVQLVISIAVMLTLSPLLTLVVLSMLPALWLAGGQLRKWVYPSSLDAQAKQGDLANIADESIVGVRVVKGFGQEQAQLARLEAAARSLYASRIRNVRLNAKWAPVLSAVPSLASVALLLLGGTLVRRSTVSIGTFIAFATYLGQLIAPIRFSAMVFALSQMARAGAERVYELLDLQTAVVERSEAIALPDGPGVVELRDVVFSFVRDEPVLNGLNLRVAAGEAVGIVGASGSGKSTVTLLLSRLVDSGPGSVTIDGYDVKDVTLNSLRRCVGVVHDDAFLFSASVRANVAFGRPDASDDEVRVALRQAEALDFVEALPNGIDTVVGEQGLTLSGGQRQRLSLARALLTDPRVLVLDDATSALDVRTEAEIQATLRKVMHGRTTIVIAHRRSTLSLVDRVLLLDRGRVIDSGTDAELLRRSQPYRVLMTGDLDGPSDTAVPVAPGSTPVVPTVVPSYVPSVKATSAGPLAGGPPSSIRVGQPLETRGGGPGGVGGGPPGGGMGGGMMGGGFTIVPTEKTLARLAALPPANDRPPEDAATALDGALRDTTVPKWSALLRPHRKLLGAGLVLVVIEAMTTVIGPGLIGRGIDTVTRRTPGGWSLGATVSAFLVAALVGLFASRGSALLIGVVGERLLYGLRLRVGAHLQRLGLDFYERELTGRILTRVTGDVDALASVVQQGVVALLLNVLLVIGVAGFLLFTNLTLGLVALATFPLLVVATLWFRRVSSVAYLSVRDRVSGVNANLAESFAGAKVTQAFGRERRSVQEFGAIVDDYRASRLDAQRAASAYFPVVDALSVIASALVLWRGVGLVRDGSVSAGQLAAYLLLLAQLFAPIQQLTTVIDTWQQAGAAMSKLRDLFREPSTVERPLPEHAQHVPASTHGRKRGVRIELRGVRFSYASSPNEALKGVDLSIEAGESVAIVGPTGAGKSTIVKLLPRFYDPTVGQIMVEGIDLRACDLDEWRSMLGYVPQEPMLFGATIADNIRFGRPSASIEDVERAARLVGADTFIEEFPDGYSTYVQARGKSLAAGQRQLIALARAALVKPRLLLLDEATATLDLSTEAVVQEALSVLAEGATTVVVAHRLDTARRADRVVVIDDGRVVEQGSHDQLISIAGVYRRMWELAATGGEARL